jgi:hypothetical protein
MGDRMSYLKSFSIVMFFALVACTQFLENDDAGKNTYTGDDGCVYCHTNDERLKVLAQEEQGSDAGGG